MNINILFIIISTCLIMIFFLFEPLNIKKQNFVDIPQFNLTTFTLYELNTQGLTTYMLGDKSVKYSNRYEVDNMDYTDNSSELIANMKSKRGLYKNNIVDLDGDVVYTREDGLEFTTDKIIYNKKTGIANTNAEFIMLRENDKVVGTSLMYNNLLRKATITNVIANYQIQENKQ